MRDKKMLKSITKALSLVTQLGISMVVPIVICLFIGVFLDRSLNTSPLFLLVFILLGIGAGFRSVYMLTKNFYDSKDTYFDVNKYKNKKEVGSGEGDKPSEK